MLPPWKRPDNFSVRAHQAIVEDVNGIHHQSPIGKQEILNSPHGRSVVAGGGNAGPSVFRMKVTTAAASPDTVLAQRWDGTTQGGQDIAVRVYWAREVGEELLAVRPIGGTDAIYNGQPVDYEELWTPPRAQYDGMSFAYEGGQWVLAFTQAPALPTL